MKIGLIYGGRSAEHDVSCISAGTVYAQLLRHGYEVICIGMELSGRMYLQEPVLSSGTSLQITSDESKTLSVIPFGGLLCGGQTLAVDILFPLVHGSFGEDGLLQGLLEFTGLPYAGCRTAASALTMKKSLAKSIIAEQGLATAPFLCIDTLDDQDALHRFIEEQGLPVFVKPDSCGSSIGISKVCDPQELGPALEEAFRYDQSIIIEKGISALEIECSIVTEGSGLFVSHTGRISPEQNFYTYQEKYHAVCENTAVPSGIDSQKDQEVQSFSARCFRLLSCSGYARVDCFIEEDTGKVFFNEINTIPGMTDTSLFIRMCEYSGLLWEGFFEAVFTDALEQSRRSRERCFDKTGSKR